MTGQADVSWLAEIYSESEEIVVSEPLAFPWDSLDLASVRAPITIKLSDESLLDLAALEPVFEQLVPGDIIDSPDVAVASYLESRHGLPRDGWQQDERARQKRIELNRRRVIERLTREAHSRGDEVIHLLGLHAHLERDETKTTTIIHEVAPPRIASTLTEVPGCRLIEVWGLRSEPGGPTAAGVLAYRVAPLDS